MRKSYKHKALKLITITKHQFLTITIKSRKFNNFGSVFPVSRHNIQNCVANQNEDIRKEGGIIQL